MDDEPRKPPEQYYEFAEHALRGVKLVIDAVFEKSGMGEQEYPPFILSVLTNLTAAMLVELAGNAPLARATLDVTLARLKQATEEAIEANLPKLN